MLDSNANIEQFIYTACGKDAKGDFGIWSASNQELKQTSYNREILNILSIIRDGNVVLEKDSFGKPIRQTFDKQISTSRELKPDAKPSGLFRKTYKDNDYEVVERVIRDEIHVVQESGSDGLKKQIGNSDFRENEEKAPYRTAWTKLDDGRLLLCRTSAIGRVYSQSDLRMGNVFYHAYIFPTGTEITDINLSKVEFWKGLDKKYWTENPEPAPNFLPTLKAKDLYHKQSFSQAKDTSKQTKNVTEQQKTTTKQTKNTSEQVKLPQNKQKIESQHTSSTSNNELLELFKKSRLSKDAKEKLTCKQEFAKQVKLGANIPALINNLYEQCFEKLKQNQDITTEEYLIIELQIMNTPFDALFSNARKFCDLREQKSTCYTDDLDILNQKIESTKKDIKKLMTNIDLDKLIDISYETQREISNEAKFNSLMQSGKLGSTLTAEQKTRDSAANLLYRVSKTMKQSNLTFDEQKII